MGEVKGLCNTRTTETTTQTGRQRVYYSSLVILYVVECGIRSQNECHHVQIANVKHEGYGKYRQFRL